MSGPELRTDPLSGLRTLVAGPDGGLVVAQGGPAAPDARGDLFHRIPAAGAVEDLGPGERLAALGVPDAVAAVEGWRARMREHPQAAYVHLHRDESGDGARTRLTALEAVPALVARERERFGAYATRTLGQNLLGDLVQEEVRRRERVVAIDDEAVLLVPFAARAPYALLLAPRRVQARFEDPAGPSGAALLHRALELLQRRLGSVAVAVWVRTAPRGAESFCWHAELVPGPAVPDGLGLGTGLDVLGVAPEVAAGELRELHRA